MIECNSVCRILQVTTPIAQCLFSIGSECYIIRIDSSINTLEQGKDFCQCLFLAQGLCFYSCFNGIDRCSKGCKFVSILAFLSLDVVCNGSKSSLNGIKLIAIVRNSFYCGSNSFQLLAVVWQCLDGCNDSTQLFGIVRQCSDSLLDFFESCGIVWSILDGSFDGSHLFAVVWNVLDSCFDGSKLVAIIRHTLDGCFDSLQLVGIIRQCLDSCFEQCKLVFQSQCLCLHGSFDDGQLSIQCACQGIDSIYQSLLLAVLVTLHLFNGCSKSGNGSLLLHCAIVDGIHYFGEVVVYSHIDCVIDFGSILLTSGKDAGCSHQCDDGKQE